MESGCCSIHSAGHRAQGKTKALWDGWEVKGLRAEDCGEKAVAPVGRRPQQTESKIVKPDHAAESPALLFGLFTEGGQRNHTGRRVGQGLPPSPSSSPSPSPFVVSSIKFCSPEINKNNNDNKFLLEHPEGEATHHIVGQPKLGQRLRGPAGLNFPD